MSRTARRGLVVTVAVAVVVLGGWLVVVRAGQAGLAATLLAAAGLVALVGGFWLSRRRRTRLLVQLRAEHPVAYFIQLVGARETHVVTSAPDRLVVWSMRRGRLEEVGRVPRNALDVTVAPLPRSHLHERDGVVVCHHGEPVVRGWLVRDRLHLGSTPLQGPELEEAIRRVRSGR